MRSQSLSATPPQRRLPPDRTYAAVPTNRGPHRSHGSCARHAVPQEIELRSSDHSPRSFIFPLGDECVSSLAGHGDDLIVIPQLRLLVAVDGDETFAMIDRLCRQECKIVATVKDGWAMLRAAEEHSPDLIIADLDMSGLDGIEATARLSGHRRDIPVVILSSQSAQEFVDEAFEIGAAGYVHKRDADQELMLAVHSVMGGRRFVSRACRL